MGDHFELSSFGLKRKSMYRFQNVEGQKFDTVKERRIKRKQERKNRKRGRA
jgi:hypothetical protein